MMVWHCHARPPPKQVAEAPKIKKRPINAAVTKLKMGTYSHILIRSIMPFAARFMLFPYTNNANPIH